jgi:predicted dehydrogenase
VAGAVVARPGFGRGALGANDDLRAAVIGLRGRGRDLIEDLRRQPGVRLVAICDADAKVLAGERERLAKGEPATDKRPAREALAVAAHADYRRLLDDPAIDVVFIATPNHWHALMAIQACQAGKDVYVEKPVSHNVWEGRQLVSAARRSGRVVQCGMQSRSNPGMRAAIEFVRAGKLGKVLLARGLCYKRRASIGKVAAPQAVPEHVDYDLWCGPAPKSPLRRRSLHYDWHWVWDTGNGDLGNQGVHQVDMCAWALGCSQLPEQVAALGGRFGYDDDGETPNTQLVLWDYPTPILFEVRGLPSRKAEPAEPGQKAKEPAMDRDGGVSIGCVFHCEQGRVELTSYEGGVAWDGDGGKVAEFKGGGDHLADFFAAVRARRPEAVAAPPEAGHLSSALCHLGNIAWRLGRALGGDALDRALRSEPLRTAGARLRQHLAANGVDVAAAPLRVGPELRFDPKSETFPDDGDASALLTRAYREPFVVREVS